ncbi:MAG TPA: hypothetical protein VKU61_02525 [Candidatus Binatia bacterium]|nr:hypothetical protein [Candidatus Binatia bacterium]
MRRRVRWHAVGLLAIALVVLATGRARAAGRANTLRRGVTNVLLGPFDVALSPVVTAKGLYENASAAGYSLPETAVLELIGGPGWFLPVTAGTGIFRIMSGFAEIPVGLVLLVSKSFTSWEPDPFFETAGKPALVSFPNGPIPIAFGVNYLAGR